MHQLIDFESDGETVRSLCACDWVSTPAPTRWDAGLQWRRHLDDAFPLVGASVDAAADERGATARARRS